MRVGIDDARPPVARFGIVAVSPTEITLQDLGPWSEHRTITNDAEGVVARLRDAGHLPPGRRLLYRDSDGELTEIVHEFGCFVRFAVPEVSP